MIETLFSSSEGNVKRMAFSEGKEIVSGVDAKDVLIKAIDLTIPSKRSWKHLLNYQVESLHFFPPNEVFSLTILRKEAPPSRLQATCFTTTKKHLSHLIEEWKDLELEPSYISTVPNALLRYAEYYYSLEGSYCIMHLGLKQTTCVFVDRKIVEKSHSFPIGISSLLEGARESGYASLEAIDFSREGNAVVEPVFAKMQLLTSSLHQAFSSFALSKKVPLLLTGQTTLAPKVTKHLQKRLDTFVSDFLPEVPEEKERPDLRKYAISIGLIFDVLQKDERSLEFRKNELIPLRFVKNRFWAVASYLFLFCALFGGSYSNISSYLEKKEERITKFVKKHLEEDQTLSSRSVSISQNTLQGTLDHWRSTLAKETKPLPFGKPYPKVSSVLSWIQQVLAEKNAFLHNFSFLVHERPHKKAPSKPYSVQIEAEIQTLSQEAKESLRTFFLTECSRVDPEKPISFTEEGKRCKVSFYLKGETL
ncbi:MAG: hypothetical protein AAGI90_00585 [Chlamydiota bacterium]